MGPCLVIRIDSKLMPPDAFCAHRRARTRAFHSFARSTAAPRNPSPSTLLMRSWVSHYVAAVADTALPQAFRTGAVGGHTQLVSQLTRRLEAKNKAAYPDSGIKNQQRSAYSPGPSNTPGERFGELALTPFCDRQQLRCNRSKQ